MNVVSLCDRTANMLGPWRDAGHRCYAVDIQHTPGEHERNGIVYVGSDVRDWLPPSDVGIAFAFPPCTDLANSGNRWKRAKGMMRRGRAIELVGRCLSILEWMGCPYMLENPVGTLSREWAPDETFDPCDYGGYLDPPADAYTKKTCLWTGGGFVMPERRRVDPVDGSRMHLLPPGVERSDLRSETPIGFALAVMLANSGQHTTAAAAAKGDES